MVVSWIEKLLPTPPLKKVLAQGLKLLTTVDELYERLPALRNPLSAGVDHANPADGIWRDPDFLAALTQTNRQLALRRKDARAFVANHADDQEDLDLTSHLAWAPLQPPLEGAAFSLLDGFFLEAIRDSATAPWTRRVLEEGRLYLHVGQADAHLQEAHVTLAPVLEHLREQTATGPVDANLGLLDLLYQLGSFAEFDATYERFRQGHAQGATRLIPWLGELREANDFSKSYRGKFAKLLAQLITVRTMRHLRPDPLLAEAERAYLELTGSSAEESAAVPRRRDSPGPAVVLPTPLLFGFKLPAPDELAHLSEGFRTLLPALNPADPLFARHQAVLGLWTCFVLRHSLDLALCLPLLAKLIPDSEALGLLLGTLRGEVASYAGDYEDAYLAFGAAYTLGQELLARHTSLDEAQTLAAQLFLGRVCQWQGNALFYLADYAAARRAYEQAQSHLPADDPETAVLQAINLGNLAFLSNNLVDHRGYITYEKAEQVLLKGEEPEPFLRLKYDKNRAALAQAEEHYGRALELLAALPASAEPRSWQAMIKISLGNVHWVKGNLVRAAAQVSARLAANLAELGTPEQLYRQALEGLTEAHELALATGGNRPLQGACLAGMSELQLLLGALQQAEETALKCLVLLGDSDPAAGAVLDPVAQQGTFYPENCWRVYLTLARSYERQGRAEEAEQAYERTLQIVEAMRTMLRSDQWQVAALQDKLEVYECYSHFLYHADRVANAPRIFELAEKLKARAFLDLLESARLDLEALMPAHLREGRQALAAEFSARNTAIAQELRQAAPDAARVDELLQAQRNLATRWQALQSQINAAVAEQAQELLPAPLSWADAQRLLASQPDLVTLSFIVGNDHSYLLVADAAGLAVFEIPARAVIEFAVGRLVWYAQRTPLRFAEFFKTNRATVAAVLGPALEAGLLERIKDKQVVIIPDGMLHYLPFEMLLALPPVDRAGQPIDPATYRASGPDTPRHADELAVDLLPFYLLGHCTISYVQSLSVWQMLAQQSPGAPEREALGVYRIHYAVDAPSGPGHQRAQEMGIAYVDLPQTDRVARVLSLFDQPAGADSRVLALSAWNEDQTPCPPERQSNERNFKELLQQHSVRYLIFAGHGVFNDKYPSFSGLVFNLASPHPEELAGDESPEDGFFSLNDIFSLRMRDTELTFLAACQGGLGTLSRGEGVNAVTRGLMYRGSPSVIASLWSVDVLATMELAEEFFRRLHGQPAVDKGRALQAAKQALCASADRPHFAHPYYWAPFVLLGKR